jgi:BASS family bile acid:Na+ symporter
MDLKQLVILALQLSVVCTVFGFGLKTTTDDMVSLVRRPGLLVRSLLAVFIVMPAVVVALTRLFNFLPVVEIALVALAISPMPPLLPQRQAKAGGDTSYGLGLMAVLALASIVMVPLALKFLTVVFERPLAMAPGTLARIVLISAILPLAAGMAVRAFLPRLASSIEKPVALVAKGLLVPGVVVLLIATAPAVWVLVGDGTIVAILLFLAIGFAVGHVMAGSDPERSLVLALSTACRHPAIAFSIAAANFPEERFGAVIVLYVLLGAVAGLPYLAWEQRRIQQGTLNAELRTSNPKR